MKVRTHAVARAAYERVKERADQEDRDAYGQLVHRLPGMILQNGLAQATGFLMAKGSAEHKKLLDDLEDVLATTGVIDRNDELHHRVIEANVPETIRLTRATLEASGWIKRYVQGVLRVSSAGEDTERGDS